MTQTMDVEALARAQNGQATTNYGTIFAELMAKGIPESEIHPRENVFTFHAWKALGRSVKKGEHGVHVVTWVPVAEVRNVDTNEIERPAGKRPKTAVVFHISQTEPESNRLRERRGKAYHYSRRPERTVARTNDAKDAVTVATILSGFQPV
mgnify:CR=1 FL=1